MIKSYEEFLREEQWRVVLWDEIPESLRFYPSERRLAHAGPFATCCGASRVYGGWSGDAPGERAPRLIKRCLVPVPRGRARCYRHKQNALRIVRNAVDPDEVSRQWEALMDVYA